VCKNANMKLVEMETKEEFAAMQKNLKDSGENHWSFAGVQRNEAGKWKWINGGEISSEISFFDLMDSEEEREPCLTFDESKYAELTILECDTGSSLVTCEKVEKVVVNQETGVRQALDDKPKFKKLGKYGLDIK
jgi:hypothetical protein